MCNIKLENGVQQTGASDCGLFAIAYATTLAFKADSSQTRYNQKLMREHLLDCFAAKTMKPFP